MRPGRSFPTGLCLSLMAVQAKHLGRVRPVVDRLAICVSDVVVALGWLVPPWLRVTPRPPFTNVRVGGITRHGELLFSCW